MKIPPTYQITPEILELVAKIDANRFFLSSSDIPYQIKNEIHRSSLLKSSLFSARIEGNPLTLAKLAISPKTIKKLEIFNILGAINFLERNVKPNKKITKKLILKLHRIVMKNLSDCPGKFRKEPGAIFNQARIAVYLSLPASRVPRLIENLLTYANSKKEKFPLIKAIITHLVFEKIHPFLDGNGRVGRLLLAAILKANNYDFGLCIPFEEYVESHRQDYYYFLESGFRDIQGYLLFMLEAFYQQTEKIKKELSITKESRIFLPPRREEIYLLIKDHQTVSFDFIKRRFLSVPERTLRYDLKKLVDEGLIVKIGQTRGSFYKVVS